MQLLSPHPFSGLVIMYGKQTSAGLRKLRATICEVFDSG